jgi:hypothetical protein
MTRSVWKETEELGMYTKLLLAGCRYDEANRKDVGEQADAERTSVWNA